MPGGDLKPGVRERLCGGQPLVNTTKNVKLYVGNLSFNTTTDDLQAAFEPFGTVTEVALIGVTASRAARAGLPL